MFLKYLFKMQVDKNKNPPLWRFPPNCEFLHLFEVYIAPALHLNRDKLFMPAIGAGTGWDGGAGSLPNFFSNQLTPELRGANFAHPLQLAPPTGMTALCAQY